MVKFSPWKFALVDGIAALISVPTQILILAHYGEPILEGLRKFKFVVLGLGLIALVVYLVMKWRDSKKAAA